MVINKYSFINIRLCVLPSNEVKPETKYDATFKVHLYFLFYYIPYL